jgi:hypothetical protein
MSGDVRRPCRYRWKISEKCKCLKNTLRRVSDLKNFPTGKFFFRPGRPTNHPGSGPAFTAGQPLASGADVLDKSHGPCGRWQKTRIQGSLCPRGFGPTPILCQVVMGDSPSFLSQNLFDNAPSLFRVVLGTSRRPELGCSFSDAPAHGI